MHIKSIYTTALLFFPYKPYTRAGFEPGLSFPQAEAMTTAPRRQGYM
jgi:hypothetical protein